MTKPIFLLGEIWGENEAKTQRAFCGATGAQLLSMLADADALALTPTDRALLRNFWATRDPWALDKIWENHSAELFRTNVFNIRTGKVEDLCGPKAGALAGYSKLTKAGYIPAILEPELTRLGDEILAHDPNLIVCLGNTAIWAMLGAPGVTKLRGTTATSTHCVSGYKLLCTYHPSAVNRTWELRPTVVADLSKINTERDDGYVQRPHVEIWTEPTLEDIETFFRTYVYGPPTCPLLSVDIETSGQQITCIGFAPRRDLALVVPIHDSRTARGSYWPTKEAERRCWELVRSVLEDRKVKKVFHNGLYDIAFLLRSYGIKTFGAAEDTMLAHHALQPESLKALGYLGSIYCDLGPWKSEHRSARTIKRDA